MKIKFSNILPYTILLISISSILQWCSLPIGNTIIWWFLQSIILFLFFKLSPKKYTIFPIKLFLIYVGISATYGAIFMTENYWDWKLLVNNLMVFSLPISAYVYARPSIFTKTLRVWLKYAWIILICLMPFLASDAYGRFLVPFTFLALFLPLLNKKFLCFTLIAYIITMTLGEESRSDMLKFSVTILLGIFVWITWLRKYIPIITKILFIFFFLAPPIFFTLGATGIFNIFKIEEEFGLDKDKYIRESRTSGTEYSILGDTRTFLYVEEISSAIQHNYVLQGRSIARGYDSISFGEGIDKALGIKRGERQSCETSILNIFNYFGIIGVILYFFIFFIAAYKAIFKSKNQYIPIIGIYIAFRWLFAWIEDFSRFDLNYLFLWIMIGICYSPIFRSMNNQEFKSWFKTLIYK